MRADYDMLFTTQSQLLASLNAARAINAYERRFHTFARVPLLVIDDFGLKPLRAPQDEDFYDLVAERYEQGATIVNSNLNFSGWGDAFRNRLLGAATLDRLHHDAYRLTLEGEGYPLPDPCRRPQDQPLLQEENRRNDHLVRAPRSAPLRGSTNPDSGGSMRVISDIDVPSVVAVDVAPKRALTHLEQPYRVLLCQPPSLPTTVGFLESHPLDLYYTGQTICS